MTVQKTRHTGGITDCTAEEQVTTLRDENLVLQDETQISRDETFVLRETNSSFQFKSEFKGHAHLCKFTTLLTLSSSIIQALSPMS